MFIPFTPGSIYSTDAITVDLICCKTGLNVLGGKTSNIAFQHDGDGNEKGKKVILNRLDYQNKVTLSLASIHNCKMAYL